MYTHTHTHSRHYFETDSCSVRCRDMLLLPRQLCLFSRVAIKEREREKSNIFPRPQHNMKQMKKFVSIMRISGGHGHVANSPSRSHSVDERPIATHRDRGRARVALSPDDGLVGETSTDNAGNGFGVGNNPQGSPPKANPRILRSGEGPRPPPPRE